MVLGEMVNAIDSKEDLTKFINALRNDLNCNTSEWENTNLQDYLEAMQSWIEDMDGWEKNCNIDTSKINRWQLIGHVLLASSIYE